MKKLLATLNWLRLLDEDGLLSLTNVAAIVAITKVALHPTLDAATITAFLAAMGSYHFKRWHAARGTDISQANTVALQQATNDALARLTALEAETTKLKLTNGYLDGTNQL